MTSEPLTWSVRRAQPEDVPQVAQLWGLRVEEHEAVSQMLTEPAEGCGTVHYVLASGPTVGAVFALTEVWRPRPPRRFVYHNWAVAPRFRGHSLIPKIFDWLQVPDTLGAGNEVVAVVDPRQELAQRAFADNGFQPAAGFSWSAGSAVSA